MKNIELKPGRAGNITITTPNGKIVIGVDQPYNSEPETCLYFTDPFNRSTVTVNLTDLLAAYAEKE